MFYIIKEIFLFMAKLVVELIARGGDLSVYLTCEILLVGGREGRPAPTCGWVEEPRPYLWMGERISALTKLPRKTLKRI